MTDPIKIQFRPGINRETTNYGNTGGWYDCNLCRIKTNTWSSMGGWQKFTASPGLGTFRSLFPWSTLRGSTFYGAGTNLKYYIIQGNSLVDITPIRRTVTLGTDPFETDAMGSTTIIVTDVDNGSAMGDFVTYSGTTGPIDGIPASEFNIEHRVISIIDDDHYTISVTTPASVGGVSGGGASVEAAYQINVGLDTSALSDGWGTGPWGEGGWGEGSGTFVETNQLRLWTEDNYGEDLLFNARNSAIYYKDMSTGVSVRAVNLASLSDTGHIPIIARQVLVSDNDRHVLAFACNPVDSDIQDRLLLRWSETEDLTNWLPDTTNTAGSLRIEGGSQFLKAIETVTEILVFTDITLHSLQFIGPPFTFGITRIATNIQLIGPNAVTSTGAITAWMANGRFQWYDGVVRDMPCDVRSYIFDILNTSQTEKIVAGVNRQFAEFIWLLPVNGSNENNFYVICNYEDPTTLVWYYGSFNSVGRTTWLDAWYEDAPLAASPDGYIYLHETGATDQSTTPASQLNSYLRSSVFELGSGATFMYVSRIIPDVSFDSSTTATPGATITFTKRDYPGSPFVGGPDAPVSQTVALPLQQYTPKVDKRFRARSVEIGIESTAIGTQWQWGVPRIYAAPDGQQ